MNVADFDYALPTASIAQEPSPRRDASRLLVLDRTSGERRHRRFVDLEDEIAPGDLLVLNDTRVIPARLIGSKPSGGRVEALLVEPTDPDPEAPVWRAMLKASRKPLTGTRLRFAAGLEAEVVRRDADVWLLRLEHPSRDPMAVVESHGAVPLPPYIRRADDDPRADRDRERYQTVFARVSGSAAAPTAGLHFTDDLLSRLRARGIETASITLHVGPGTFLPVRAARIDEHRLHEEPYEVSASTADAIAIARRRGGRIVAVGTTVVRALESAARADGTIAPGAGRTGLFIRPGYEFRAVDAMITNFHLPRSTLLMLVCAFAGTERVLAAYREAIELGYRFYSYGDAMYLRPA